MNALEIAKARYTTKHYDSSKVVSKEDEKKLLEILRLAPSSVNAQPWHFFVADTEAAKQKILPAVLDFNYPRVTESTFTVVFAAKEKVDDAWLKKVLAKEDADGRFPSADLKNAQDQGRRHFVGLNDPQSLVWDSRQVYLAVGYITFAAASMGIDTTIIEGINPAKMDEILGLKAQGLRTLLCVSFGYRAADDGNASRPKSRLDAADVISVL